MGKNDFEVRVSLKEEAKGASQLADAAQKIVSAIGALEAAQGKFIGAGVANAGKLTAEIGRLDKASVKSANITLGSTKAQEKLAESFGATSTATQKAERARQSYYETRNAQAEQYRLTIRESELMQAQYYQLRSLNYAYGMMGDVAGSVGDTILGKTSAIFDAYVDVADALQMVRRTTVGIGEDASAMNDQLLQVMDSVAVGTQAVADIAEIGGAANVAAEDMREFSEATAIFADSTEVSAEKSALSIARIYNLTKGNNQNLTFSNLSNSLFVTANEAASTADQVLDLTTRLAPLASQFDVSADQIIALGSSLASFGVEAQMGGTSMIRSFAGISKAVSEEGKRLELLAKISKMTSGEFAQAWASDPGEAFTALLDGMNSVEYGGNKFMATMAELGFNATRDGRTWLALASNMEELKRQMGTAKGALDGGSEMFDRYGERIQTVAQQMELLKQNVDTLSFTALKGLPLVFNRINCINTNTY